MKCTECPEYNECRKKYNLTIRRRRCPKAKEEKAVTNADRIRAMSDEELAEYLADIASEANNGVIYSDRPEEWLEYLQQPAEVDGDGET